MAQKCVILLLCAYSKCQNKRLKKKRRHILHVLKDYYDDTMKKLKSYVLFLLKGDPIIETFLGFFFFFSFLVRPGPITHWAGVHSFHLVWQCHIVSDTFNSVGKKKRIAEEYAKQFVFSIRFLLLTGSLIYAMLFISINGYNSLHSNKKPARIDISRWTAHHS